MSERRAQTIGAVVLAAALLTATAVVLLDGAHWRQTLRVHVYMQHSGSLSEGDPVIVAGREIGWVDVVSIVPGSRAEPDDPLAGGGGVALHVVIEERYATMTSIHSEIFVAHRGVLGRPYLVVGPPPEGVPWERSLVDGDRLRGVDPANVDEVLRRATATAVQWRQLIDEIEPSTRELGRELVALSEALRAIEPEEGAYARAAENLAAAGSELDTLTTAVGPARPGPLARHAGALVARTGAEIDVASAQLDAVARRLERAHDAIPADTLDRARRIVADARGAFTQLDDVVGEARDLFDLIDSGRGTIGGLMNDPAFAADARRVGRAILRNPWRLLGRPPER